MPNYKPFPLTDLTTSGPLLSRPKKVERSITPRSAGRESAPGRSMIQSSHRADNRMGIAPHLARALSAQDAPEPRPRKPDIPGVNGEYMSRSEINAGHILFLWKQPGWTIERILERVPASRKTAYNVIRRKTWVATLPLKPDWWTD